MTENNQSNWQNIIWREWRYAEDTQYANHLFELVANEPINKTGIMFIALDGALPGMISGLLIGLIFVEVLKSSGSPLGIGLALLFIIYSGLAGSLISLIILYPLERKFSVRATLNWFTPHILTLKFFIIVLTGFICGCGGMCIFSILSAQLLPTIEHNLTNGWSDTIRYWPLAVGFALGSSVIQGFTLWCYGLIFRKNIEIIRPYRLLWFWWWRRPSPIELKTALQNRIGQIPPMWQEFLRNLEDKQLEQEKLLTGSMELADNKFQSQLASPYDSSPHINFLLGLVAQLENDSWQERTVASYTLLPLAKKSGGVVDSLQTMIRQRKTSRQTRKIALRLLYQICRETIHHFKGIPELVCPFCLTHCYPHRISLPLRRPVTYCGCRTCGQSWEWLELKNIVMVLNSAWSEEMKQQDSILWVNGLRRQTLFDFDWVEIEQASDEEVERFAVQVGNDTDIVRQPGYKRMRCIVSSTCHLSDNTLKILDSVFGQVRLIEV